MDDAGNYRVDLFNEHVDRTMAELEKVMSLHVPDLETFKELLRVCTVTSDS